jgi:hypothetical protein
MSKELVETLDALNNERPEVLQLKRKNFFLEGDISLTHKERIEEMRLNAEKDRINKYKKIALEQSRFYYVLLESFVKLLNVKMASGLGVNSFSTE